MCLLFIKNEWYQANQPIIDLCDIPFYFILAILSIKGLFYYLFYKANVLKLTLLQKEAFIVCWIYLAFKVWNMKSLNLGMFWFLTWNYSIVLYPFVLWFLRQINPEIVNKIETFLLGKK